MGDTLSPKITDKVLYIQHLDRSRYDSTDLFRIIGQDRTGYQNCRNDCELIKVIRAKEITFIFSEPGYHAAPAADSRRRTGWHA